MQKFLGIGAVVIASIMLLLSGVSREGGDLQSKTWVWESALYNDSREIKPKTPGSFVITFGEDSKFSVKTDCNSVGGSFVAEDGQISMSDIYMTKMYCEGSQEMEFIKMLENTSSYHFDTEGELILDLKFDSGSVVFR